MTCDDSAPRQMPAQDERLEAAVRAFEGAAGWGPGDSTVRGVLAVIDAARRFDAPKPRHVIYGDDERIRCSCGWVSAVGAARFTEVKEHLRERYPAPAADPPQQVQSLPDCMMPDGAEPCAGFRYLADQYRRERREVDRLLIAARQPREITDEAVEAIRAKVREQFPGYPITAPVTRAIIEAARLK